MSLSHSGIDPVVTNRIPTRKRLTGHPHAEPLERCPRSMGGLGLPNSTQYLFCFVVQCLAVFGGQRQRQAGQGIKGSDVSVVRKGLIGLIHTLNPAGQPFPDLVGIRLEERSSRVYQQPFTLIFGRVTGLLDGLATPVISSRLGVVPHNGWNSDVATPQWAMAQSGSAWIMASNSARAWVYIM